MNYADDISSTVRRISASLSMMDAEERKKLAEYLRGASSNLATMLSQLEKGA
jgi:hypothetical protein